MPSRAPLPLARAAAAAFLALAACRGDRAAGPEPVRGPVSALELSVQVEPDTVALDGVLTVALHARNPLAVPVRAPGPCPWTALGLRVTAPDGVESRTGSFGVGGCKVPGPATVDLPPGWDYGAAAKGTARLFLPPASGPGTYRLRAVYATSADSAVGPEILLVVTPAGAPGRAP